MTATGTTPLALTHTGDMDFTYPNSSLPGTIVLPIPPLPSNITVSGSNALGVTTTLTDSSHIGFIIVDNDGAGVTVTQTGPGSIIVNNELGSAGVTATQTGSGHMIIDNTCTAAVTVTNTGDGHITVVATGSEAITLTYTDGLDHVYP